MITTRTSLNTHTEIEALRRRVQADMQEIHWMDAFLSQFEEVFPASDCPAQRAVEGISERTQVQRPVRQS
jgi:hypothetical protein